MISMDGGNQIYGNIAPLWDGEDERFDVDDVSPDELKCLPNLRKMVLMTSNIERISKLCSEFDIEAVRL